MKPGYTNINLSVPIDLWNTLKEQYGKFPKMWGDMFHMFAAFIGETSDYGAQIKEDFPLVWKVVDAMEVKDP